MGELDKLLASDSDNAANWRKNFQGFHPDLPAALDSAAEMFITFGRCLEGRSSDVKDWETFLQCSQELGITKDELADRLEMPAGSSDEPSILSRAREALVQMFARRSRSVVFLLLQRYFMWGATDLMRMRIIPADGYRRLEAEAIALLVLMQKDSCLADRWRRIRTDADGREFFRQIQPQLKATMQRLRLDSAYDQGSAEAQHVRMASAILSLSWTDGRVQLNYQEFPPDQPFICFLGLLGFLSTQVYVFHALSEAFPEVTDPLWETRVKLFTREYSRIHDHLEARFPRESRELKERAKELGLTPEPAE